MAQFVWCDKETAKELINEGYKPLKENGDICIFNANNKLIRFVKFKNIKMYYTNRLTF